MDTAYVDSMDTAYVDSMDTAADMLEAATWQAVMKWDPPDTCQPRVTTWHPRGVDVDNTKTRHSLARTWDLLDRNLRISVPDTELVLYPLQDKLTSGDKSLDLSAFKLSSLFFSLLSSGSSSRMGLSESIATTH
ncbi:hypothetical protein Tco_0987953 [Tanacetum coccineum]